MKAIDNVFKNTAPGQVEKMNVECFQQDKEEREENDIAGMPIEHGHYSRKKLSDAQINHFLDFCSMEESCKMLLVELHLKDYQLEGEQKFWILWEQLMKQK